MSLFLTKKQYNKIDIKKVTTWVWIATAIFVCTFALIISLWNGWHCINHYIKWWKINLWFYSTTVKCY